MSDDEVSDSFVQRYVERETKSCNIDFDGDEHLFHSFPIMDDEVSDADVERYVRNEIVVKTTLWFCEGKSAMPYIRRFTPT
jgi:hypothetical protein